MPCRLPAAPHRVAGRAHARLSSTVGAVLEKRSIPAAAAIEMPRAGCRASSLAVKWTPVAVKWRQMA